MVQITSFFGFAALLATLAAARPTEVYDDGSYNAVYGASPDAASPAPAYADVGAAASYAPASAPTSVSAAEPVSSPAVYGSGSGGGATYNDCVNKCVADFGSPAASVAPPADTATVSAPPAEVTAPPAEATATPTEGGSSGTGATHTVIVAPTQGVLRFVPFALNATIGSTVKFVWGGNTHTVTKGSALLPCNKTSDALFTSGVHDKGFVFEQVVNTTDPIYYFCNTPGHCAKGMFGVINPVSSVGATSISSSIGKLTSSDPDVAAMAAYTQKKVGANAAASNWGKNIDISAMPEWARAAAIENTFYTRTLIAANPEIMSAEGVLDIGAIGTNPLMVPQDISVALAAVAASSTAAAPVSTETPSLTPVGAAAQSQNNAAMSTGSSKILVGLSALIATFFLL